MSDDESSVEPSAPSTPEKEPLWVTVAWIVIPLTLGLLVAAAIWI
jgi:hypothetical protein